LRRGLTAEELSPVRWTSENAESAITKMKKGYISAAKGWKKSVCNEEPYPRG